MERRLVAVACMLALGLAAGCGAGDDTEPDDVADTADAIDTSDGTGTDDGVVPDVEDVPEDTVEDVPADTVEDVPADVVEDTADAADEATVACIDPQTPINGEHNAGRNCLSCHTGGGAPRWTLAGTLYDSAAGTTPVAGATIVVTPSSGSEIRLVTGSNGNFYTSAAIAYPATVRASLCPDDQTMPMAVESSGAACNTCHAAGNRVHLP